MDVNRKRERQCDECIDVPNPPSPPAVIVPSKWNAIDTLEPCELEKIRHQKETFELHSAINNYDIEQVKKYVIEKRYWLEGVLYYNTALTLAFKEERYDLVEFLLDNDANVDSSPNFKLLHLAAIKHGQDELLEQLLTTYKANVDCQDNEKRTPLHYAAYIGNVKAVKLLLDNGAKVNAADYCLFTPLHCAAQSGHTAIVQMLLSCGASVNMCNVFGWSPLFYGVRDITSKTHFNICDILLMAGASTLLVDKDSNTVVHIAISGDDISLIGNVRNLDFDVDALERHRLLKFQPITSKVCDMFNLSRSQSLVEYLKLLLNHSADPDSSNKFRDTPLSLTLRRHELQAGIFLIQAGASCKQVVQHSITPQRTLFDRRAGIRRMSSDQDRHLFGMYDIIRIKSLQDSCRITIRDVIKMSKRFDIKMYVHQLPLPRNVKLFLCFDV